MISWLSNNCLYVVIMLIMHQNAHAFVTITGHFESLYITGVHGDGDGGNPAESAGFPRVWIRMLREYLGDGSDNCGIPAGMDFITAGTPH